MGFSKYIEHSDNKEYEIIDAFYSFTYILNITQLL